MEREIPKSLGDRAFDEIERMIVLQELEPGALISEKQLMDRVGIGRTPIREALQRLARHRLVEIHPQRGVLVPPSSIEDQLKLLELRRTLEAMAARLAAERATLTERRRCQELHDAFANADADGGAFLKLLRKAHDLIVECAHNEFLSVAMAPLQGLSRRFWYSHLQDPDRQIREAREFHADIIAAIVHGDPTQAESASLQLNDYLVDFTFKTLPPRNSSIT